MKLAALSETELVYYLNILEQVAQIAADEMCKHKDKLHAVLDAAIKVEERPGVRSRKVIKGAMHLLRALLSSLVTFRPKESRSVPPHMWNDPHWRRTHYTTWGHVVSLSDVALEWRGPSKEGLQWAADLQARYLAEPIMVLRAFLKQEDARKVGVTSSRPASQTNTPMAAADAPQTPTAATASTAAAAAEAVGGEGAKGAQGASRFPPPPLTISPDKLTSSPLTPASAGAGGGGGIVTSIEATAAVVQISMVSQGLVYVQLPWDAAEEVDVEAVQGSLDHSSFKAVNAHLTDDAVPDLVSLPPPSQGNTASRHEIAALLHQLTTSVIAKRGEDVKLLQALAKSLDTTLNGIDVVQKKLNRLRIRYTLIKSQFTEKDGLQKLMPRVMMVARIQHHHMRVMMQRHRKLRSTPLLTSLLSNITQLATYHYRRYAAIYAP